MQRCSPSPRSTHVSQGTCWNSSLYRRVPGSVRRAWSSSGAGIQPGEANSDAGVGWAAGIRPQVPHPGASGSVLVFAGKLRNRQDQADLDRRSFSTTSRLFRAEEMRDISRVASARTKAAAERTFGSGSRRRESGRCRSLVTASRAAWIVQSPGTPQGRSSAGPQRPGGGPSQGTSPRCWQRPLAATRVRVSARSPGCPVAVIRSRNSLPELPPRSCCLGGLRLSTAAPAPALAPRRRRKQAS